MGALDGRTAVVTGATRGIGFAIAERLVADGADVLVTGRTPDGKRPDGCRYAAVDFADSDQLGGFAATLVETPPDILINNAGINVVAPFADIDPEDFQRIQQVNVVAPFRLSKAVLPGMRRKKWGRILTISSIWGKISKAGRGSYSTSKFGVDGMMTALAAEVAADGILVNCVAPGFVDTELTRHVLSAQDIESLTMLVPIRRLAQPSEIAEFVAWLVGPANTYINGQNIAIDGGFTRV